jgi:hypothetical protein
VPFSANRAVSAQQQWLARAAAFMGAVARYDGPHLMATRSRDEWVSEFLDQLEELRPDLSTAIKFRHTLALHEWAAHRDMDPREAARQWAKKPHAAP